MPGARERGSSGPARRILMLARRVLPAFVKIAPLYALALILFTLEPVTGGEIRALWWFVTIEMVLLLVAPVVFLVLLLGEFRRG